jgi:hypothetical protein
MDDGLMTGPTPTMSQWRGAQTDGRGFAEFAASLPLIGLG